MKINKNLQGNHQIPGKFQSDQNQSKKKKRKQKII